MNVLSLFDGISCGQVALERAGLKVDKYYASEIDKYVIQVTQKNYPDTVQIGDVTKIHYENGILEYENVMQDVGRIDLLIGGSPCQSLSITRSKEREHLDGKSKLFFEFLRLLKDVNPKYFLFENVASMNNESKSIISEMLECEPLLINSNCFVPQDRPRLYWTNIPVDMKLQECQLTLKDILENKVDEKYFYNYNLLNLDMTKQVCAIMNFNNHDMHKRIFNLDFKVHTLTTCGGGNTQKKVYQNGRC